MGLDGALSLHFLQEPTLSLSKGRVAMLPTRLYVFARTPLCMRSWYLPSAKNAKNGIPQCVGDVSEIKSPGHPPASPIILERGAGPAPKLNSPVSALSDS